MLLLLLIVMNVVTKTHTAQQVSGRPGNRGGEYIYVCILFEKKNRKDKAKSRRVVFEGYSPVCCGCDEEEMAAKAKNIT